MDRIDNFKDKFNEVFAQLADKIGNSLGSIPAYK